MDYPGLNLKSLTTDELLNRMVKCREKLAACQHNPALSQNILTILDAYEYEYRDRQFMERMEKENEKNPPGVINIGTIEEIDNKEK